MPRKHREPTIGVRRYRLADGSTSETWSVRFYDAGGVRCRRAFATREEAEFERARLALEQSRGGPLLATAVEPAGEEGLTLAEFWPTWRGDAASRLAPSTLREYERLWNRRLRERFGHLRLDEIRPRMVSQWRAELLDAGVGTEATRYAMVLLQAMFSVAIEWGEATTNPVSVVRKPRQGRRRAVEPLSPDAIERIRAVLLADGDVRAATLVCVLAYAGLRPGEALGLEWRHVRESTLLVEQAVSDGQLKRQKTNRVYRTVDLIAPLAEDLAALARRRRCRRRERLRLPAQRRRPVAHGRLEQLAPPPLRPGDRARRPRPAPPLRPAPLVRLAADPRAAHLDRRARGAARPRADDDAQHVRARVRRAPAGRAGRRRRVGPGGPERRRIRTLIDNRRPAVALRCRRAGDTRRARCEAAPGRSSRRGRGRRGSARARYRAAIAARCSEASRLPISDPS